MVISGPNGRVVDVQVLDVDGRVIAAETLLSRVDDLLKVIDAAEQSEVALTGPRNGVPAPLDAPVHAMRLIHRELHPPDIGPARGLKGHASTFTKRVVRKLTQWYVEPRWVVQQDFDAQNVDFASLAYNSVRRIDAELEDLRRQNARLKLQLVVAREKANELRHGVREELRNAATKDDIRPLSQELNALISRLGAIGTSGATIDYVGFEDRFRGSSTDLRASQERYVTLFPPASEPGKILDIGCGRGEMLSLLAEVGHQVMGIDLDEGMVEVCTEKGLPAEVDDGVHFLSHSLDDSFKGIFCAQVVEHLITPELEQMIALAYKKLLPGGVLVIETINPRSSFALGNHFFADTSHVRPVHPETLRFICEQIGFARVQLEERSPHEAMELSGELPEDPMGRAVGTLLENVFGFQDYVVVATK